MAFRNGRTSMLATAALGAALVLTSCTCHIKEDQQAMINQLRTNEKQLNADIAKAEGDKTRIMKELSAREAEVRTCNERKAFVQDKMNKWPNIWPDWDPNAPAPVEETPEKSTKKKQR
jgi:outer membrane murein-binding lipoprotein Lpp